MFDLSWNRRSKPLIIGSGKEGSGVLFPGDLDQFETVHVPSKKMKSFLGHLRRGFKRIAERITKAAGVFLIRWEMGGKKWTAREVRTMKVNQWKEVVESKEPILIEVLVSWEGGAKVVSNTFHLVYPNNRPVLQKKSLDTYDSLMDGARSKTKKGDTWKALKRYQKALKVAGKKPEEVEQLQQLFNSSTGLMHRIKEVLDAIRAVGENKVTPALKKAAKRQLEVFADQVQTAPFPNTIVKKLKGAKSRFSLKALEGISTTLGKRVQREARAAKKRMKIKF